MTRAWRLGGSPDGRKNSTSTALGPTIVGVSGAIPLTMVSSREDVMTQPETFRQVVVSSRLNFTNSSQL